jgi:large subunit ribosomal protein L35
LVGTAGSHQKWRNSNTGKQVVVPHHRGRILPWAPCAQSWKAAGWIETRGLVKRSADATCDTLEQLAASAAESWKNPMPKLKTHKGASKRFKKTGTGKVVRHHAFARHILTSKVRSRKRKLKHDVVADPSDQAKLKRMIPY